MNDYIVISIFFLNKNVFFNIRNYDLKFYIILELTIAISSYLLILIII